MSAVHLTDFGTADVVALFTASICVTFGICGRRADVIITAARIDVNVAAATLAATAAVIVAVVAVASTAAAAVIAARRADVGVGVAGAAPAGTLGATADAAGAAVVDAAAGVHAWVWEIAGSEANVRVQATETTPRQEWPSSKWLFLPTRTYLFCATMLANYSIS